MRHPVPTFRPKPAITCPRRTMDPKTPPRRAPARSRPDVVFGLLEIAGEDVDRLPSPRPHDGGGVEAPGEKILRRPHPHRMTAEGLHLCEIEPRPLRGLLHEALDGGRAEIAVHGPALVDRTKEPFDVRAAQFQPDAQEVGCLARSEGDAPRAEGVRLAPSDKDAEGAVRSLLQIVCPERHEFRPPA